MSELPPAVDRPDVVADKGKPDAQGAYDPVFPRTTASESEIRNRIFLATGYPNGLPSSMAIYEFNRSRTAAGCVLADVDTYTAARDGTANIVTDAAQLRPDPGTYVFQSSGDSTGPHYAADDPTFNMGLLILNDPKYIEGQDIKLTFPLDAELCKDLARTTQGRVFAPPEGHLARRAADDSLVVVDASEYGFGGPPYPAASTAEWVVIAPQPRAFSVVDLPPNWQAAVS